MSWTLNEIASSIDSNIRGGLHGSYNTALSIQQLEREVIAERGRLLFESFQQGKFDVTGYMQSANGIKVDMQSLSKCTKVIESRPLTTRDTLEATPYLVDKGPIQYKGLTYVPGSVFIPSKGSTFAPIPSDGKGCLYKLHQDATKTKHFILPKINPLIGDMAIDYLGSSLRNENSWKSYFDSRFSLHKYKAAISEKPYVWIDTTPRQDGFYDCFIFNFPDSIQFVSITAIFENPYDLEAYSYGDAIEEFPAPEWVVEEIIQRVTKKFIYYYRQLNVPLQPNTGTDHTT